MKFINKIYLILTSLVFLNTSIFATTMDIYALVSANIQYVAPLNTTIKKNDTLIKLDDNKILFKIKKYEEQLALKKLLLDDDYKIYLENKDLFEKTLISQRVYDVSKINYDKSQYEYNISLAQLQKVKEKQKSYTIKAPFNCKVIALPNIMNATSKYSPKILMQIQKIK
jgi:hypothetical protein